MFIKQITPTRVHPIALPDRITPERFNELLKPLGIDQCPKKYFGPSNAKQQIKRRYETIDNTNSNDDELDFDCHENRENNEQQLYKRISNLSKNSAKKCRY